MWAMVNTPDIEPNNPLTRTPHSHFIIPFEGVLTMAHVPFRFSILVYDRRQALPSHAYEGSGHELLTDAGPNPTWRLMGPSGFDVRAWGVRIEEVLIDKRFCKGFGAVVR